jgi:hypothetical protein
MARLFYSTESVQLASNAIAVGEPYKGVRYQWLQLSGRGIEKPADAHGYGVLLPQLITTYWPGGTEDLPDGTVGIMDYTDDKEDVVDLHHVDEEGRWVRELHRQIYGMDLADTTLVAGKYETGYEARVAIDIGALKTSYDQHVPLGAVAISRVVSHNQLREGRHMASLYFPEKTLYPVYVLKAIQRALRARDRTISA